MLKRFSRMVIILIILLFGGVITTHASISDSNNQSGEEATKGNQQTTFHHYMKTFFGNWYVGNGSKKPSIKNPSKNKDEIERPSKPKTEESTDQNQTSNEESINKSEPTTKDDSLSDLSQYEQEVVELTNQERTNAGLAPLKVDLELSRVAQEKSRDMSINNYFDHNSPVYGSPFDMIQSYEINYRTAGENIAKGQRSPQEVVQGWMNSPGHRANILNEAFTHIGVGFVDQGNHWTQMFIGK